MASTFDANSSASVTANGVTSITSSNLTVGSGSNRALVTQLGWGAVSLSISALTVRWDELGTPQSMTVVTGASATHGTTLRADLWGLVAPTSGAKQCKAAWTGSADVVMNMVSWSSVDQTGGTTSFAHGASNNIAGVGNASLTITSAANNATMDCLATAGTPSAPNQTQTFLNSTPANESAAGQRAAGAATVAHTWSDNTSAGSIQVGCDIVQFTASGVTAAQEIGIFDQQLSGQFVGLLWK